MAPLQFIQHVKHLKLCTFINLLLVKFWEEWNQKSESWKINFRKTRCFLWFLWPIGRWRKEKILILRPFFGKRHFVWPPLSFLWCGCLAFKKGSYWSHLFHPVVIVVQSEKWTTLYECEIGLDFWRIWWCWWCFTKFMTNILWIHFLLICFHGKLAELTLFLWNSSYLERNIDFWCCWPN